MKADREKLAFRNEFGERINMILFTKEKSRDEDEDEDDDYNNEADRNITRKINLVTGDGDADDKRNMSLITVKQIGKQKEKPIVIQPVTKSEEVNGETYLFDVTGLDYFQDYEFQVSYC